MDLQNTTDNLSHRADRDLAHRTGWAAIVYLVCYALFIGFTPYLSDHKGEVVALGVALLFPGLTRTAFVIKFDKWYAANPAKWRSAFITTTLLLAAVWGMFCMRTVINYHIEWTAMLVLLATAGIAAVAITTLSIYLYLVSSFIFLLLTPSIFATFYLRTTESLAVMLMFSVFAIYLFIVARRLNREYWVALENAVLLDQRAKQLEDSNKELESYSYSIAHDLRGPLRTITAFSQILLTDAHRRLNDDEKDYLDRIVNAGQYMAELIDDILELSRITRINIQYSNVNISELAQQCLQDLQVSDPRSAIVIEIHPDIHTRGDERLLKIVMQNLLSNAWKFTANRDNAQITVGEMNKDATRVFYVRDNGVGFDMKYANKIFGIFQRLHTRDEFEGTGIGLASVERIVHRHGGRIWVDAGVNNGATFYFTLAK